MAAQIKLHEPIMDVHVPIVDVVTMHRSDLGLIDQPMQLLCSYYVYVYVCVYACVYVYIYV